MTITALHATEDDDRCADCGHLPGCSCPHFCAPEAEPGPAAPAAPAITPGVTLAVPRGADVTRPGSAYRLVIRAVYPHPEPGLARVGGTVLRADGSPSTRRHGYRDAHLRLAMVSPVLADADTEGDG